MNTRQIPIRSLVFLLIFVVGSYYETRLSLTSDRVLQFARQLGLMESVLDRAEHQAQPALHLEHSPDDRLSWLGGAPSVPGGFKWPYWQGRPLSFVAQFDLAEVAAALESTCLPARGQLYFFFTNDESGPGGYEPSDRGAWRVIYNEAEHSALAAAEIPAGLDTAARFPRVGLAFRPIASVPSVERLMGRWEPSSEEFDAMRSAQNAPFHQQPRHQLFGLPVPEQDDQMELQCQLAANGIDVGIEAASRNPRLSKVLAGASAWRLLLQVDTDDVTDMMWGDAGLLYFWIREADAAKHDFSQVWMILQSG